MAGTFPTSQGFTAINFKSNLPTLVTETNSGIVYRRQIAGQRFSFTLSFPPMTRDEFAPVYAFVMKQRTQAESFNVTPPIISSTRGSETGTVLVNGIHSAGDTTIDIDGLNSGLKAGDVIKFASHSKIYMITDDANADSNGEATITIEPALRESLANDEAITYNNVPFTVRITNDVQEFNLGTDPVYRFEIDVIEDL
jgi:hypothetical protein